MTTNQTMVEIKNNKPPIYIYVCICMNAILSVEHNGVVKGHSHQKQLL